MSEDERWALYVTVPALVLSMPVYVVAVGYYWCCREAFAGSLEFIEACEGMALGRPRPDRSVA